MSKINPAAPIGPVEMIAESEGRAIPAPGVLFEEQQAKHLAVTGDAVELAPGSLSLPSPAQLYGSQKRRISRVGRRLLAGGGP